MLLRSPDGINFFIMVENEEKIYRIFKDKEDRKENLYGPKSLKGFNILNEKYPLKTVIGEVDNYFLTIIDFKRHIHDNINEYSVEGIGPILLEISDMAHYSLNYCKIGDKEYGEKVE